MKKNYKVGIIGCGSIFPRHKEAIDENDNFELVAICDIQKGLVESLSKKLKVKGYVDYQEMITQSGCDLVVVASPNSLHYEQSIFSLKNKCDVLIEKPVTFDEKYIKKISDCAKENNQKAYCVLQVRLNPTVEILRKTLNQNLLGTIRGVSLIQRWQRPLEYFSGWRAEPSIGGGTLYEVGIHYLDILQSLFGTPEVVASKVYTVKHKASEIEDTIYSILDFGDYGGTCEINISSEPHNLECSISILGSNGYVKLGGKALNIIESYNFLSNGSTKKFESILEDIPNSINPNSYGSYLGSCPNHPTLYSKIEEFELEESYNSIKLINDIYKKADIKYGE